MLTGQWPEIQSRQALRVALISQSGQTHIGDAQRIPGEAKGDEKVAEDYQTFTVIPNLIYVRAPAAGFGHLPRVSECFGRLTGDIRLRVHTRVPSQNPSGAELRLPADGHSRHRSAFTYTQTWSSSR